MTFASKSPFLASRGGRALTIAVVAAPLGFLAGKLLFRFEAAGLWSTPDLDWSEVLALALALTMLVVGLITVAVSASRKALGRQIDPESRRPATAAQAWFYAQNGGVLALAGLMLATPVVVRAVLDPLPPALASSAMIGVIALFLAQVAGNLSVWVRSDELMRRAMAEIAALSFAILQGALFLWAAGEKLDLLPTLSLWDAASVMMAAYLLIAVVVTWRRGLAD